MEKYLNAYQPQEFLIESAFNGMQYSATSLQQIFKKYFGNQNKKDYFYSTLYKHKK